jgi:type I restriction enzyme R subunit
MDKKQMSEVEIRSKFITPAINKSGWTGEKIRENVSFTEGRIIISGKTIKRGQRKEPDYVLEYKPNLPLAICEAKDNNHSIGDGMQQALDYAKHLDIPFVFSSNGDGFIFHDRFIGKEVEIKLSDFPSPKELWEKYKSYKGITEKIEDTITTDYYYAPDYKKPRYYQKIAINRTIEAIAKGQKRILLVMATGTGKTYAAFQTIWRLKNANKIKKVLYLADRNILVDQPKNNDLKPLSKMITKISKRKVDKAFEVYLALYQAVSGEEEWKNIYKEFKPDSFDLVIVDECHRGSAKTDSPWREILDYFKPAIQIGMTATPKETKDASNIDYFGKPIYTYSLKQGIADGFLAPYRVIKVVLDKDVEGYRPKKGEVDKYGNPIPDYVYTGREFDRTLVIDERSVVVAKKITEFLKKTDRFSKTIVFCVDIEHAERMRRALINENSDLYSKNDKYIMRITGDNEIGKRQLDNFIDPASKYPVIATTSKLMNTGVDTQTCKLIVLDSPIQSMTEFRQIIGRGSRIKEDYGKYYFTIIDFRNVTNLFADPKFDGEPIQIYVNKQKDELKLPEIGNKKDESLESGEMLLVSPTIALKEAAEVKKYYVSGVDVAVIHEAVQYHDSSGKLITESLKDFTKKNMEKEYKSLNDFINKWTTGERKQAIIGELENHGILFEALQAEIGEDYDPFDLILHVAYGQKPLTRKQRASKVQKDSYFNKYGDKARKVISALLDKYADEGIEDIENPEVLKVEPLIRFGRPLEIMKLFGGIQGYKGMIKEIENRLYK